VHYCWVRRAVLTAVRSSTSAPISRRSATTCRRHSSRGSASRTLVWAPPSPSSLRASRAGRPQTADVS
jgi:hypothetical protein